HAPGAPPSPPPPGGERPPPPPQTPPPAPGGAEGQMRKRGRWRRFRCRWSSLRSFFRQPPR
ncbi:hypothetical protein GAY28_32010, partial [Azospirillum brasilense]|nr:hypothetical protein [Azospirillum brasilense]